MFPVKFLGVILLLAGAVLAARAAQTKTLVFFGDSLTAGYGLPDPDLAFPGLIQQKIDQENLPWKVVNAGLSGDTTSDGVRRVDWILRRPIDMFVLELGANDALRGLPVDLAKENLQSVIDRVKKIQPKAQIVLVGMDAPRNLGNDYTESFAAIFPALAQKNHIALVPSLLEGVGGVAELNQADEKHPTEKGHAILAQTVWKTIGPLVKPTNGS